MNKKILGLIGLVIVSSLVLSACQKWNKKEEILTLTESQEPPSLDSAKSVDIVSSKVLNNTMEGLLRSGKNGTTVLGMAAEMPVLSNDRKIYTFKLRDALWSDGVPVTAHDFVFGWKRALTPNNAAEFSYLLYSIQNAEAYNTHKANWDAVGIKAVNDKTLQIILNHPTPYFLGLLGLPIFLPQREDIYQKYGVEYALESNKLVFNGPFILSEWKHGKSMKYSKNIHYWDEQSVRLNEVNVVILNDAVTGLNLYKTGKVDYAELAPEFIDEYRNDPDVFEIKDMATFMLHMNHTKHFFQNLKVRQAISLAINREELTKKVLKNGSRPASGLVLPEFRHTTDKSFITRYAPLRAKRLWDEGVRESGEMPSTIELVGDDTSGSKATLQFLKEAFRQNLGLDVTIISVPFKQRLELGRTGRFDLLLGARFGQYNDPMTFLDLYVTGGSFNRGKWSNLEYDRLVENSRINPNVHERTNNLIKAEQLLINKAGIVPLYYRSRLALKRKYIKDWVWSIVGSESSLRWAYIDGKS